MKTVYVAGERINLLDLQEVSSILGTCERTTRQYIVDGFIPACKIRRRLFVTDKNLSKFIRGASSTRRKTKVAPPKYDDGEADPWEQD